MNKTSFLTACLLILLVIPLFTLCSDNREDGATIEILPGKTIGNDVPANKREVRSAPLQPSRTDVDSPGESSAFELGERSAGKMMEKASTTDEIRDGLLDLRAREYAIRCQEGEKAAEEYLDGIRHYLLENADTLASILF